MKPLDVFSSGSLIANRYEVVLGPREKRELAGGMGLVFLCLDHAAQRQPVALKTFRPDYLSNREARDRFLREGTTWVKLGRHPHVVRAYRVERVGDGREMYLVLEWVAQAAGQRDASLRAWLAPGKPLPLDQSLVFALHIARGLMHATLTIPGFVHRDLKPENVLVGADGNARVTDFGLVKSLSIDADEKVRKAEFSSAHTQLTQDGLIGTPLYMSPEQWVPGGTVDVRADIYAFGCILYEMVVGKPPAKPIGTPSLEQVRQEWSIGALPIDLPTEICELVRRCLALRPENRYANWEEIEAAVAKAYRRLTGKDAPLEAAAENQTSSERLMLGWSYIAIGTSYCDISKYDVAVEYFERARQIGQTINNRALLGAGLVNLGNAHRDLGNAQGAIEFYGQALDLYRKLGNPKGQCAALGGLGVAYAALGAVHRAIEFCQCTLALAIETDDRKDQAIALLNLGTNYQKLGETRSAVESLEECRTVAREIQDRYLEGNCLGNLGAAHAAMGDETQAISFYEQSLAIAREVGDRKSEGLTLGNLGYLYRFSGNRKRALELFTQRLTIAREIGDRVGEATVLGNIGAVYSDIGDLQHAIEAFEEYLAVTQEIDDRTGEGRALGNLAFAYQGLGQVALASDLYHKSLEIAEETGDSMGGAFTSYNFATLLVANAKFTEAAARAESAAQVFEKIGHAAFAQNARQLSTGLKAILAKLSQPD